MTNLNDIAALLKEMIEQQVAMRADIADLQSQIHQPRSQETQTALIRTRDDSPSSLHVGLPALSEMYNLELTFYDNGPGTKGRSRYNIKAEIAEGRIDFRKDSRHHVAFAGLTDYWGFEIQLKKRTISDTYRASVLDTWKSLHEHRETIMLGMFAIKGGRKGMVWHEHQFIVVHLGGHETAKMPIGHAVLSIAGTSYLAQEWCSKHPKTGKTFADPLIKGKSISYPQKDLMATQGAA